MVGVLGGGTLYWLGLSNGRWGTAGAGEGIGLGWTGLLLRGGNGLARMSLLWNAPGQVVVNTYLAVSLRWLWGWLALSVRVWLGGEVEMALAWLFLFLASGGGVGLAPEERYGSVVLEHAFF